MMNLKPSQQTNILTEFDNDDLFVMSEKTASGYVGAVTKFSTLKTKLADEPVVHARLSSRQSIPNNIYTTIIWTVKDKDTQNFLNTSNGNFSPTLPGTYRVMTYINMDMGDGKLVTIGITRACMQNQKREILRQERLSRQS